MRARTWCVAAALACLPSLAAAQTVLSEADALARLSADSPRVRAIRSAVEVTRAEGLAASRWPNPRVTYNREAVAGVTEHMFLVTQLLPITGRREFDISAAAALVNASQLRADEELRQIRAALRRAYTDLATAQARESEIAGARDRLRELAAILARREAAGDAAGYDQLRAQREVMDLDADLAAARVDRTRAQAGLAEFFAPATDVTSLVASDRSPSHPPLPTVDELLAHAQASLPEFAALKQDIASAEFAMRAAGRRPIPDPEVVGGTKSSNLGGRDVGSVFSVHVAVPLFDRAKPEQALADARRAQAEARTAALQASLHARIAALRSVVSERRQAADSYRASTAVNATQLERIAQVSYDAGERGILELLDAYRNSGAARVRQASLDGATRQAEIELELVSGWEIR
jgi:cobalt-zinc-cadmium efflux system outer membrane protein